MTLILRAAALFVVILFSSHASANDSYQAALAKFKQAGETHSFFASAYGYALFPTVGKGGFGIGAAYGEGKVFANGQATGSTSLSQVSIGFQLGGQAYSEIIFFENRQAYDTFTSGSFEFGAQASAVALNVGVNAQAGTTGTSAQAGSAASAQYINGMTVFTLAKGGLMYEAALAGQAFSFTPY
ncbi:YSC84-related protein [Shewanella sp. NIFS-20-20]|uniref:lipid-binding SYLF domain-containing protein n=1 Tax=Shewanella sp. NIFS-20-20 TaxID=2853806 RepID=UPI001C448FE4|nr:lipid-binding SYLF domain-containing protein [Shewanella sp. NIFS-20-20]MBV7315652.1 lipid-binding SYLF domain-containing protein [Shewanella sp. NIFS-20-20]